MVRAPVLGCSGQACGKASSATVAHCKQSALNVFEEEREALIAMNKARMMKVCARVETHSLVYQNVPR